MKIRTIEDIAYINSVLKAYPFSLDDIQEDEYLVVPHFAGEIRFGPPYFDVDVYRNDVKIWSSGTYGGELFRHNILSRKHHKLILVKWFSFQNPDEQAIVSVDLQTAKEEIITEQGRYYLAGHFDSFDGVFYRKSGIDDVICQDLESQETFFLKALLTKHLGSIITWGLSPIKDTIIVILKRKQGNVVLFNIKSRDVESITSTELNVTKNGRIHCFLDKKSERILIEIDNYDVLDNGRIVNKNKSYQIIYF